MFLVTTTDKPPFITNWFDAENHFNAHQGMIVYDLLTREYTTDGVIWMEITVDHL
jgi:hypothetical protein